MAGNISDFLERKLLDHVLRATSYSSPATVFGALYTSATDDALAGAEVSGGSYRRMTLTFGAQSPTGTTKNNGTITWPAATARWGTITHMRIHAAASGTGSPLMHGPLTAQKAIGTGDVFRFTPNQLVATLD